MMEHGGFVAIVAAWLTAGLCAPATAATAGATGTEQTNAAWSYSASVYLYLVPNDDVYVQPTVTADRGRLHLEARYNYEDLETASLWAGYNIELGAEVSFDFTPKLGVVVGETAGIAPGYQAILAWKQFEFYSEGEYVFDADDQEDSFFYSWSEATASPSERWRAGLALQRTQVYETPREFQWGMLLGVTVGSASVSGYVFDADHEDRTYVVSVSAEF